MSKPIHLNIYIIRHGETEWSLSGQNTGSTDLPLTANGEEEARRLSSRLHNIHFEHVFVSPLKRALRTCDLAAPVTAHDIEIEANLTEWNCGDYEGRRSADIHKERPGWNIFNDGAPNGESTLQIHDRTTCLMNRLCALEGNIALFTHSHFARALAARWMGLNVGEGQHLYLNTASISILSYDPSHSKIPVIVQWNCLSITR